MRLTGRTNIGWIAVNQVGARFHQALASVSVIIEPPLITRESPVKNAKHEATVY